MTQPPQPPFNPGATPLALANLLRRRKTVYRLRRRQYDAPALPVEGSDETGPPQATPAAAADNSGQLALRAQRLERELVAASQRENAALAKVEDMRKSLADRDRAFEEAKKVLEDAKNQVLRARSDMDALRKRSQREKEDLQKFAAEDIVRQLFPVLDNFGFAMETAKAGQSAEALTAGMTMIHRELQKTLQGAGLEQLRPLGEEFDPHHHDAVSATADDTKPNGTILQVVRPGYMLRDKVLRPAMVTVNKLGKTPLPMDMAAEENSEPIRPAAMPSPLDQARHLFDSSVEGFE
ncbi:hypothetical protein BH09SUM1_BH09SUM1_15280 [soil metagenome]